MNRFLVLVCFGFAALNGTSRGEAPRYTIRALDVFPGGLDSAAFAINELGQAVGHSTLDRSGNVGQSRPVMWDANGQPQELWPRNDPFLLGGMPLGINNASQVVGRYGAGSGTPLPTLGVRQGRAFIWDRAQGQRDLGSLGSNNVEAVAINEIGQVVGTSETPTGGRAFIWDSVNGMRDLGSLGGSYSFGRGVNNRGQVTGTSWGVNNVGERAFLWDAVSGMRDLGSPTGGSARGVAINDIGEVLGIDFGIPNGQGGIAGMVIWGTETRLVPPPIGGSPTPYDISNKSQVVGSFGVNESNAFLWNSADGFEDLQQLIPNGTTWDLEAAHSINDAGQIVGFGKLNGEYRGFLMTPVPEPPSIVLIMTAVLLAALALRGGLLKRYWR